MVFFEACNSSNTSNEKQNNETSVSSNFVEISTSQFQYSAMELGMLSEHSFIESVKTNGFIDVPPSDRAMVSALMGGYVKISHLLIGEKVKKGQLLLTLENPDFIEIQQNFLETYENLNYLKSEYDRQKTLFDEKIASEKNYLKAESEYKSTLAYYNGLEQKIRMLNINPNQVKAGKFVSSIPVYAPIDGDIANVYASVGKFMNESDVLVEIINDTHKHIELVIFEKDVLSVEEGQTIIFNLPENSSTTYLGEVHLIGKSIDEKNRTVKVHGHLEDENESSFLVGMFVEAEIIVEETTKRALPLEAILEEDNSFFILMLKEQNDTEFIFEKKAVQIGMKDEGWIEIIDTNNELEGKQILIKGAFIPLMDNEE
jgi:cobalt-zinc-cadmium efflux system membrane fusion protein